MSKLFFQKHIHRGWFVLLFLTITVNLLKAESETDPNQKHPILILSSYNPETQQIAKNISEFLDEYKSLGGKAPVAIENMNCKGFSDALIWKGQIKSILDKYTGDKAPKLIIILGQEAWSSYISQDNLHTRNIPVICGMVSRNAIILPNDSVDLSTWEPESIDVFKDIKDLNLKGGYIYEYDIDKNIQLIKDFYPTTRHIAFISDNSYGGVCLQAHVKHEISTKHPELKLILLDGRKHTIYTIVEQIETLPEQTAILIGTWRVDKNDGYFMQNATYSMMSANPKAPAFTIASVGFGHWALGGYCPQYRYIGKGMAQQVIHTLDKKDKTKSHIEVIANNYRFDAKRLASFGLTNKKLPMGSEIENQEISFIQQYRFQIIGISSAFAILLISFLTALYFFIRAKKSKDNLEISEAELRIAKENAEESSRLKTAFLANMSHEIRTPLNAIVGFSTVLTSDACSPEEQHQYSEIIQTNSDLLLRLINDILDVSRLESGRLAFNYEICNITSLCQGVLTTVEHAKKNNVAYLFKPSVNILMIETDVQRLQQVLINLLSNATKFTTKGEITLSFTVDEEQNLVTFAVSDTGCGIPKEKQQLVFERFEKLNEYAQGTGLGLSICKLTVTKLGGEIKLDTNYEAGARFVFTHPIRHTNQ